MPIPRIPIGDEAAAMHYAAWKRIYWASLIAFWEDWLQRYPGDARAEWRLNCCRTLGAKWLAKDAAA